MPALLELLATIRQDLLVGTQGVQSQKQQRKAKAQAQALATKRCAAVGMAIQQCCAALESCTGAAELLVQEVAQGYFLNLLILFLAMLGRFSALLRHIGTLAFGLYQALEGRVGEIEAGQEGGKQQGRRPRLSMRKIAHALRLEVAPREEGTTVEGVSVKRQAEAGQDHDDDDDDLGVSLGAAAAAASFTFPIPAAPLFSVRTKVIPASTISTVPNTAATSTTGKAAVASRAMLASEYSSSSEEEEEGEDEDEAAPAKQQQQQEQQPQPPPPALPSVEELKQKEEDEASAAAIRFVIDRKPDINPPGSSSSGSGKPAKADKKQQPPPRKIMPAAVATASAGAATKREINKDKQKDKREVIGGSLLDEIDDIFNAAGAKKAKKRKMNK